MALCAQLKNYCTSNNNATEYTLRVSGNIQIQHCNMAPGENYVFTSYFQKLPASKTLNKRQ